MTVLYIEDTLLQELEQLKVALKERDAIIVEKDAIIDAVTKKNNALIKEKDELEKLNGRIKLHV